MSTPPAVRRLRIFAFDPSLATRMATIGINEITISVPWERDAKTGRSSLRPGPVGEYIEVVDCDPSSGVFYPPVDLDDPYLLAQDGLAASETNPQFHQQMVYAVAMTTIGHFERALGRVALWADHVRGYGAGGKYLNDQFIRRLRIYPHALRARNAYYSPQKKAVLFGYFPVRTKDGHNTPGTQVFTCLSHDIVAHEVTHALLDGVHPRFSEPTNPDVHAFHEAFADVVAMFQHFSYPGVLEDQIRRTRGDLAAESMLGQLAQQFGRATGRGSALRDALGQIDETGEWTRRRPDANVLQRIFEPHARGAVLVAAVFGAFLLVYEERVADLYRIATQGTGELPPGDIHPDLARRLAAEAAATAEQVLQMCIRAIDYCPPIDITFGDYLRAVITADVELNDEDELGFRIAFIESFRAWGIHPVGIRSMTPESLRWETGEEAMAEIEAAAAATAAGPRKPAMKGTGRGIATGLESKVEIRGTGDGTSKRRRYTAVTPRILEGDRFEIWRSMDRNRFAIWNWLNRGPGRDWAKAFGLVMDDKEAPPTVYRNQAGLPTVEVHAVRSAIRRSGRGGLKKDLVVEITQRRRGYFDPEKQQQMDTLGTEIDRRKDGDFKYRAGCTVMIDPVTSEVRRVIRTAGTIADTGELDRVRDFLIGDFVPGANAFDATRPPSGQSHDFKARDEPFALLHSSEEV
ncbi:MAG: hypothetical protein V3T72_03090 [Thermoanaerobaculia bacterium]